jgi:hypothetical protein
MKIKNLFHQIFCLIIISLLLFETCMRDPLVFDLSGCQLRIMSVRKKDTALSNVDSSKETFLIIEAKANNGRADNYEKLKAIIPSAFITDDTGRKSIFEKITFLINENKQQKILGVRWFFLVTKNTNYFMFQFPGEKPMKLSLTNDLYKALEIDDSAPAEGKASYDYDENGTIIREVFRSTNPTAYSGVTCEEYIYNPKGIFTR